MALIKKKTRKRLAKQMHKLVKKHGEAVVTGFVTTAVSAATARLATTAGDEPNTDRTDKKNKKHKKQKAASVAV